MAEKSQTKIKKLEDELAGMRLRLAELEAKAGRPAGENGEEDHCRATIENSPIGFVYGKIILQDSRPVDILILKVNKAFEKLTGFKNATGKKVTEIYPAGSGINPEVFELFNWAASGGNLDKFEIYSAPFKTWFSISVTSPAPGFFTAWFEVVTERKKAEAALQEREAQYRTLVENTPDIIARFDRKGRFIFANQAIAQLTSLMPRYYPGKSVRDIGFKEDTARAFEDAVRQTFDTRKAFETDLEFGDGMERRYFNWRFVPEYGDKGNVKAVASTGRDISEHRRLEKAMQESEEKYRLLFENVEEGFALFDVIQDQNGKVVDFRILDANKAFEHHTGMKREDLIGKTMLETFPEMDPLRIEIYARVALTGEPLQVERYSKVFDRHLRIRAFSPRRGLYAIIFEDITARKQSELKLQEGEEKYHMLFETSRDGIFIALPDGKVLSANPAACSMLQMTEEEIIEAGRDSLIDGSDPRLQAALEERTRTGSFTGELTYVRKDGSKFPVELTSVIYRTSMGEERSSTIFRDISKRKQAEEALCKSKAQYDNLAANVPVGIYLLHTTPEGTTAFDYVSPKMAEMLDETPESFLGDVQVLYKLIHPDDLFSLLKLNQDRKKQPQSVEWAGRAVVKGAVKWLRIQSSPEVLENGNILWHGVVVDITESKLAEEALQKSEERFHSLVEHSPVAIVITRGGYPIYANSKLKKMFGVQTTEELEKRPVFEYYAPQYREDSKERTQRRSQGLPVETEFEVVLQRTDGSQFPGHVLVDFVQLADGPANVTFVYDISERKQAEEALRKAEEKYHGIFENATMGIFQSTPDGHYVSVNPAMARIFGYESPQEMIELVGSRIEYKIHADPQTRQTFMRALNEDGVVVDFEAKNLRKDGSQIWTRTNGRAVRDAGGGLSYYEGFLEDITERKLAEEAVKASESRWRAVFDNAGIGIVVGDTGGTFAQTNAAFQQMLGYSGPELNAMTVYDYSHPDDVAKDLDLFHSLVNHKIDQYKIEKRYIRKNGEIMWGNLAVSAGRDEEGQIQILVGMVEDITERKLAQEAIKASESRWRAVFDNAGMGISLVDFKGHPLQSNSAFHQMLGYSPAELSKMTFMEYTHPEDVENELELFHDLMDDKRDSYQMEKRYFRKDGETIWVNLTVTALRDENGRPEFALGMVKDITERKQSEEQIHFQAHLLEQVEEAVIATDVDGKYTYWNRCAEKIFGWTAEEMLGKVNSEMMTREALRTQSLEIRDALRKGQSWKGELTAYRKDGSTVPIEIMASPLYDIHNQITGLVGVVNDISGRKETQKQLIASEKLAGIGTLAAGIAHELNTPLQIITGLSDNAARRIKENRIEPERLLRNLENIGQSGWRCSAIVRSLLDYARPGGGEMQPEDLNKLVNDTLLLIEHQLKSWSSITIISELADGLPAVTCNRNQIAQVLINLLTNANKSMERGGKIGIRTGYDAPTKRVWLQVSDTGTGIAENIRAHIFDPFYTTAAPGEGTGLGLSIASTIVQSHGGEITVGDADPHGAVLTLFLPEQPVEKTKGFASGSHAEGRYGDIK